MKKKWIVLYFILLFLPFLVISVLGKIGFFDPPAPTPQPKGYTVTLYHSADETTEVLPLKDYLWGVLAGEMPASYPEEALKAQVVASYSYLLHRKNTIRTHPEGEFGHPGDVCDDPNHCKAFLSPADASARWGEDWLEASETPLAEAVNAVFGTALLYNDAPANTVFHSISGGKTESAKDVWGAEIPYLQSVDSPWDRQANGFRSQKSFSLDEFKERLGQTDCTLGAITLTEGGSVASVTIGERRFSGRELRSLLDLRSTRFTIEIEKNEVIVCVYGYGHQVGMSQHGASVLANEGYSYKEILSYYYPGTTLAEYYFDE